jgi:hypothetical protein
MEQLGEEIALNHGKIESGAAELVRRHQDKGEILLFLVGG